ncbi:SGNH/GDSL hydrolase family protein [Termitidicoccus mucosus]|uniref:SGNH/GDSL hydrolase family protein n=1 Tax=Termitidicoccus mucosus TaxID=1184151 RepID=UPI002FEE31A2
MPAYAAHADGAARVLVPATDARIHFSDGLPPLRNEADGSVHFDRVLDTPGRGFRWDSPGTRMRWRTDSARVAARLRYTARHTGSSRNSTGAFRIDGDAKPGWTFTRPEGADSTLAVTLPAPDDGAMHNYEVILPYGDSVDLLGVEVGADAAWETPTARPGTRYVAFGDSVTHGFTASVVTRTYAFLVAEKNNWELLNLGIGGRGAQAADGDVLASIDAGVISVLIGVNDWQGGAEPETFRDHYRALLDGILAGHPDTPVFLITPLWVPPRWRPEAVRYPLENYRRVIRKLAAERATPRLRVIEGPSLIDHRDDCFDPVAVHPNDAGFAQMAERLAQAMRRNSRKERRP